MSLKPTGYTNSSPRSLDLGAPASLTSKRYVGSSHLALVDQPMNRLSNLISKMLVWVLGRLAGARLTTGGST